MARQSRMSTASLSRIPSTSLLGQAMRWRLRLVPRMALDALLREANYKAFRLDGQELVEDAAYVDEIYAVPAA